MRDRFRGDRWHTNALACLAISVVVAFAYARVVRNAPVWDDAPLTVQNPFLRAWSDVHVLVTRDIWTASGVGEASRFYRPLPMVSYLLDARLFGATASTFHVVNAVLHATNAVLLFAFARTRRLAQGVFLPCAVALGFGVAPLSVEAVAWIAGRFDLLGTALVLCALLANRGDGWRAGILTTLFLGLALLCKESFALGGVLLVLDDRLLFSRPLRSRVARYSAYLGVVAAFLLARSLVGVISVTAVTGTGAAALATSFAFLLATYVRALLDPRVLDPFRPYAPFGVLGTTAVLVAVACVGAALTRWRGRRRARPSDPRPGAVALGFAWVLVGFAPVSLAGPNLGMVGDRYAYFPIIGIFVATCAAASLAAEWLVTRAPANANALVVVTTLIAGLALGGAVARTRARLLDWRDERSLFNASLRDDPENAYALYSLGFLDAEEGRFGDADALLVRALAVTPRAWRALDALCYTRLHERRLRSAEHLCLESAKENATNPRVWVNLASVYVNHADWPAGLEAASRAVMLKPGAAEPHFLRAACLANLGDYASAREEVDAALAVSPAHPGALDLRRRLTRTPD